MINKSWIYLGEAEKNGAEMKKAGHFLTGKMHITKLCDGHIWHSYVFYIFWKMSKYCKKVVKMLKKRKFKCSVFKIKNSKFEKNLNKNLEATPKVQNK